MKKDGRVAFFFWLGFNVMIPGLEKVGGFGLGVPSWFGRGEGGNLY